MTKNLRDKIPNGLDKSEILTAEAMLDTPYKPATKIYFSGTLLGVSVALDGESIAAAYLLAMLNKAAVEFENGSYQKEEN
jgi:hypothetical protein